MTTAKGKKEIQAVVEEPKILGKNDILTADDFKMELVDVSKWWGGAVYVGTMRSDERDEWEESIMSVRADGTREQNMENFRTKLCVYCIRNAKGERIFDVSDIRKLAKKSAAAMDRVYTVAARLNGIGPKDVEELTKN